MASSTFFTTTLFLSVLLFLISIPSAFSEIESGYSLPLIEAQEGMLISESEMDLLAFALNLEFLQAEFFLNGALGHGLDHVAANLTLGGPAPLGATQANLNALTADIVAQFGYQGAAHIRALQNHVEGFPRPLMDLSAGNFANLMNKAFGHSLEAPFNPYSNSVNFLLGSYLLPYVALTAYEGLNPHLQSPAARRLCAGLLGVQSAQDAVIRALLYQHASLKVEGAGVTVAEFTGKISALRNQLGRAGNKDGGLVAPASAGVEEENHHHHHHHHHHLTGSLLAENKNSISYQRSPREVLRILYGHGTASAPGGFFPKGANGRLARSYLHNASV